MYRSILKTTRDNDFSGCTGFSKILYRTTSALWLLVSLNIVFNPSTARAAAVDWEGWSFDVSTNDNASGLVLSSANMVAPDRVCDGQSVCQHTFSRNGEQMLEIGSNWQIGE